MVGIAGLGGRPRGIEADLRGALVRGKLSAVATLSTLPAARWKEAVPFVDNAILARLSVDKVGSLRFLLNADSNSLANCCCWLSVSALGLARCVASKFEKVWAKLLAVTPPP